jgi:hypothetical protein
VVIFICFVEKGSREAQRYQVKVCQHKFTLVSNLKLDCVFWICHYSIVHGMCLKLIPHKKFLFAKMWLMDAKFEIQ